MKAATLDALPVGAAVQVKIGGQWLDGRGCTVFRCLGCGRTADVASLAACPYPTGGRGPLHRWRPVPA